MMIVNLNSSIDLFQFGATILVTTSLQLSVRTAPKVAFTQLHTSFSEQVSLLQQHSLVSSGEEYWKQRLIQLVNHRQIDIGRMGFPTDWQARPIWQ